MGNILALFFWLTVVAYAVGFSFSLIFQVFRNHQFLSHSVRVVWVGFLLHTAFVSARWFETGHPPFVSYFESMSASAWFAVLGYLWFQRRHTFVRYSGVVLLPIVTLLMGWAATQPIGGDILPVSLQSFWLFVHASFATAAVGCFIVAAGVAGVRLYKSRNGIQTAQSSEAVDVERYDEFKFRLLLLGFLFYGMMLVSGSIWAHAAWGRYWGWDPIELWSLITWIIYALYFHIYVTWKKLRGRFLAWYALVAVFVAAFSLWGVSIFYSTIHTYGG